MANNLITKTDNTTLIWKQDWRRGITGLNIKSSTTFIEVLKMGTPAVSTLNKGEQNTRNGEAVFAALISRLMQFFGATWSDMQVTECAKVLFDEYFYLTFAELAHFAIRAKTGGFKQKDRGLLYGQFSTAVLIEWFVLYAEENLPVRGSYFSMLKPDAEYEEPENPVPFERFSELVAELEQQMKEDIEKDEEKRFNDIMAYQAKMNKIYEQKQNLENKNQ